MRALPQRCALAAVRARLVAKFGLREARFNCEGGRPTSRWRMEGAALAGAGQRDRPRKGGKRTKASKAQELFEEEVKRLVKLVDVKLSLKSLRNIVEYEAAR